MSPTMPPAMEPPALTAPCAIAVDHEPAPATSWSFSPMTAFWSHGGGPLPFAGLTTIVSHRSNACCAYVGSADTNWDICAYTGGTMNVSATARTANTAR